MKPLSTPLHRIPTVIRRYALRRVLRHLPLILLMQATYSITDDGAGGLSVSRADGVNFSIGAGVVAGAILKRLDCDGC